MVQKLDAEMDGGGQIGPEPPVVMPKRRRSARPVRRIEEREAGALVRVVHEAATAGGADGHVEEQALGCRDKRPCCGQSRQPARRSIAVVARISRGRPSSSESSPER